MNRTTRTQPPKGKIVIAGGTGFIGTSLARYLAELSYEIVLLSRHVPERSGAWEHAVWDGRTVGHWSHHLEGADAVVNLTGRTVDCIKSPDHCDEILRSRVEATHVLGKAAHSLKSPPPVWVQM
ncbi:MAG: NAD-dependent epimerase/dehydratase family protein, partial [Verrucomicrobiota bacterium]|nr:NAD-dependent epimerase/dehydratase family protein [Verrucomicrobiota bacterium]